MFSFPTVVKPAGVKPLGTVDVAPLRAMADAISEEEWLLADSAKENRFECFDDTRHVILRFIRGNLDPASYYATPRWGEWSAMLLPIMRAATASYGFEQPIFPKAMLARLRAGGRITPHVDSAPSHGFTHKIHIPLTSNDQVEMRIAGKPFHLAVGEIYEVNNRVVHSVTNAGETDRTHLIFEVFDGATATIAAAAAAS